MAATGLPAIPSHLRTASQIPTKLTASRDFPLFMADTLTITDNRTGKTYEIPIADGAIRSTDLRQIKADGEDQGLVTYDPAFMNTAACRSRITYIDGDKGILEYRGYPIEQLGPRRLRAETAAMVACARHIGLC